jgi:D-alanyl-D-alanine carboxypeptidase
VPAFNAAAALVMDEASGSVMFQYNAEAPLPPASLTKIASAVVALHDGGLDRGVTVDVDYREMPRSSVMGLLPGDQFTLRDLLYGMMLPSGNDAALAVARAVAGSDAAFVARMNALVAGLGLVETDFKNPHGLGASGHLASAYDLAVLARYALSVDGFEALASARSWTARGSRTISMGNSNALVSQYSGADGVKIGYTRSAGNTIVGSATRNGHRVLVVLLNAPQHQADCRAFLDWAFANFVWPES